jgi:hypothetical protein
MGEAQADRYPRLALQPVRVGREGSEQVNDQADTQKPNTMDNPFGITKEDVLNLCVERLIEQIDGDIGETVVDIVQARVKESVAKQVPDAISKALDSELQRLLEARITPVDMWGDPTGEATTIRDQLHKRAVTFFNEKVDNEGRPTSYGGSPRYQRIYADLANTAFSKAVKDNIDTIAAAVKTSVRETIWRDMDTALNQAFNVKIKKS